MSFLFSQNLVAHGRRSCKILLAFLWCFGFGSGVLMAARTDNIASLMLACCDAGVSIVGLFFVPFFPFLISAIAVYCSIPLLVYIIGLVKSFAIGFCFCAVSRAFAGGGWLISLLLMFTDLLTAPALFLFQLRVVTEEQQRILRHGVYALVWFVTVSLADYIWIAPLLRDTI